MNQEERDELLRTIARKICVVDDKIEELFKRTNRMSDSVQNELTNLQNAVATETTVNQSALTLISGFAAQLAAAQAAAAAAGATPDQLAAFATLSTTINSNASALAAAVTANTPAASSTGTTASASGTDTTSGGGSLSTGS